MNNSIHIHNSNVENDSFSIDELLCYAIIFDSINKLKKISFIRKVPGGWAIFSEKGKHLGKYKTKQQAVKRLRQIEWFKHHKKKASSDISYSQFIRDLRESSDNKDIEKFQQIYKQFFDEALITNEKDPENIAMNKALQSFSSYQSIVVKTAAEPIELGDPVAAGRYIAAIIKFLMRRISAERRPNSFNNLKRKIYLLNENEIASKHLPAGAALGQSITTLKHVLFGHSPSYIRAVLNSVVSNL